MTSNEFAQMAAREHERLELKTGTSRKRLQESFVALSNAAGGVILIGVTDDRRVVGRLRDQGTDDDIHGAAHDAHNVGRYEIGELSVGSVRIIAVTVQPRNDEVAATSDGRILVRRGSHNRAAVGQELRALVNQRSLLRFELEDSSVAVRAVTNEMAAEVSRAFGWTAFDTERLIEQNLAIADGSTLTVAGALALTNPAESLGAAKFSIDVRAYESDSGTSYVRRESIDGPVQLQVERATEVIMRDIGTDMVITQAHRHDLPRLPRRVVRETVANAVAHRAYDLDRSPIAVELRPSAVTITSPGGLPAPVTIPTLRMSNAPRNHTVIALLRRFGLAEDSGQGIDVIEDGMKLELMADPEFSEDGAHVRVRLPLHGLVSAEERGWLAEYGRTGLVGEEERLVLLELLRNARVTNSQARDATGEDSMTARARLRRLRDAGVLVQHGTRGRAYYTLGAIGPGLSVERTVLDAAQRAPVTNQVVRELTGLDRPSALGLLRRLVGDGSLVQVGSRRGTRYKLP